MKTTLALLVCGIYFVDSEINQYHYRKDAEWYENTIMDLTTKLAKSEVAVEDLKLSLMEEKVALVKKSHKPTRKLDINKL
jgi:hypothetical protein